MSNGSNVQQPRQSSINDISSFKLASTVSTSVHDKVNDLDTSGFLPEEQFDHFHANLASEGPDLSSFPALGGGGTIVPRNFNGVYVFEHDGDRRESSGGSGQPESHIQISRNHSLIHRRDSHATKETNAASDVHAMGPPPASVATKTRRKSHFPAHNVNYDSVSKTPRKSVGWGTPPSDLVQDVVQRKRLRVRQLDGVEASASVTDAVTKSYKDYSGVQSAGQIEGLKMASKLQDKSAKSFQLASRLPPEQFPASPGSPDLSNSSTANPLFSPALSGRQRNNSPSSGKRLSIRPTTPYATGLGARTISPTDARRMKRMSMLPNSRPIESTPPAPHPDLSCSRPRSSANSPSITPRKSVTPSSSRTTPEANRKSYSSGVSSSSSTSYSSFINSLGYSRIPHSISTSRLPTPKTRVDNASIGGEEEVPPVPAIPKAYESPKGESDQPFFAVRKPSFPFDSSSQTSTLTAESTSMSAANEILKTDREPRQRLGFTNDVNARSDKKPKADPSGQRRTLQPLRLPPLNLLPLSTPTAAKIAALYDGTAPPSLGRLTPPPSIGTMTTPGTPMTASKASFFSKSTQDSRPELETVQRPSSSSLHIVRSNTSDLRTAHDADSTIPPFQDNNHSHGDLKAVSPFVSSSLPKPGSDFGYFKDSVGNPHPIEVKADVKPLRLTGPRSQKPVKGIGDETQTAENISPTERGAVPIGSSLRCKLSVGRTRSGSNNQSTAEISTDLPPKPPKHGHMPPPKLPASATWNGPLLPSESPSQRLDVLNTKRKVSNPNFSAYYDRSRSNTWRFDGSPKKDSKPSESVRTLSSTVTPRFVENGSIPSSVSLKDFLSETKSLEIQLDDDDRLAEDEMKKLASKRKDTEIAAKEIDALRQRATAKERVSSNQALRMANLNIFERGEIIDYKDIYFYGTKDAKKHEADLTTDAANFGYDDDRGDYNIVKGDHILYRYEIVDILGKGSFGQVVRCVDHKTGGLVAIKIIRNKKRFHQQALVEVDILQKLREWVSITH